MFNTSTETTRAARTVITDLQRIGATIPEPVAKVIADGEATKKGLADLIAAGDRLPALALRRVKGEKVPAAELQDALLGAALATRGSQVEQLQAASGRDLLGAVVQHAGAIIDALRPAFDEAADVIRAARESLGDVDLDDLAAVTAIGGDAAEQWKRAKQAEQRLEQVRRITVTLRQAGAYPGTNDPREAFLAVARLDMPAYKHIHRGTTMWTVAAIGELSLARPDEYRARVDALTEAWARDPKNPATRLGPGAGQYPPARGMTPDQFTPTSDTTPNGGDSHPDNGTGVEVIGGGAR